MDRISVIIPVYNGEKLIKETVGAINASTVRPYEIILVNDGSGDRSLPVCRELASLYDNVRVLDQKNGGVAAARNTGLAAAAGDYVCFVDQDDLVDPEMYATAGLRIRERTPDLIIFSTGQWIDGKKVPYEQYEDRFYEDCPSVRQLQASLLFRGFCLPERAGTVTVAPSIWKCVFRRELAAEHQLTFRRFISYEDDYIMMAELLGLARSVCTLAQTGYYWRVRPQSESHRASYLPDYGARVKALQDYMCRMLTAQGMPAAQIALYGEQLAFSRTIDVIVNAMSPVNPGGRAAGRREILDYLKTMGIFDLEPAHIRPLPAYHRLRVLYRLVLGRDAGRLIRGMHLFLETERHLWGNPRIMEFLNKGKRIHG